MKTTASRLALLAHCPSAGALSSADTDATPEQRAGTGRHRFLERAAEAGVDLALAEIAEDAPWRTQCEDLAEYLPSLPAGDYEQAFAYDTATDSARALGRVEDRAYDVTPSEVSGTADLVCPPTPAHPRWLVVDFKGEEEVPAARENLQLGFYALCVARVRGLDDVDVAIVYLGHGGAPRWDRAHLDPFDLEAVAAQVRSVHARVGAARSALARSEPPGYTTGLHCRRCPALSFCPAMVQLARELLWAAPSPETLAPLSDDDAGAAWVRVKVLGELVERAKAALDERAKVRGLPLPDGARLVPTEQTRRTVLLDRALPVLREAFGAQLDAAIEQKLPAESVSRLARQLAPGKGQKAAVDALWAKLDDAQAVKRSTFVQLRVHHPKGDA